MGQMVSGLQYQWHRDGTLVELEKKRGVTPSPFLAEMHARYGDPVAPAAQ